jgi:hypothetical protein
MSRSSYFYVLLFYHPLLKRSVIPPLGAATCSTSTVMQMFTSRRFACIYSFLCIKEKLDCQSAIESEKIKSRIASLLVENASLVVCSFCHFCCCRKYTTSEYWTCSLSPYQHLSYCPSSVVSKSILIEIF